MRRARIDRRKRFCKPARSVATKVSWANLSWKQKTQPMRLKRPAGFMLEEMLSGLERDLCAAFYSLRGEIVRTNVGVIVAEYRVAIFPRDI
jgi:hypothetical protein